jgi:phosphoribosylaminoimidazolecarboxamide formyltransferase/IMP cyclohydrolase
VATSATITNAYRQARDADALSAFGGIVGLNRPLDSTTASEIVSTFIEAVVAPSITDTAKAVLAEKKSLRVLTFDMALLNNNPIAQADARSILGGWIVQHRDEVREARSVWGESVAIPDLRVVTQRAPRPEEWTALQFAWRVCAYVKSNAVIFTREDRTVAIGAGQMSRIDAVKVATLKAPTSLTGTVAASDAFFPFRDGLDALAAAGATAVVQPGGSVRDAEVISAADEHGLAMVLTGRRHFRH